MRRLSRRPLNSTISWCFPSRFACQGAGKLTYLVSKTPGMRNRWVGTTYDARNGVLAASAGHLLSLAMGLAFQQGALPGFTRWNGSPPLGVRCLERAERLFSTWSLISGALGSMLVLLAWPCQKKEEETALSDVPPLLFIIIVSSVLGSRSGAKRTSSLEIHA